MAKKSSIEKNKQRREMVRSSQKRKDLLAWQTTRAGRWRSASRRASSWRSCPATRTPTRIRNRCEITGRPRAVYRKLGMSRIALRELGLAGPDPGPRQVELVGEAPQCR
jgi:small subunit ribosomal protein S14